MMKNATSYCLFFIALLLFSTLLPSCDKDKPTVLTGKIRDKVTGLPIEKALFNVDIVVLGDDGASHTKSEYIFTDKEGNFSYSITETDKEYIGACSASKPEYIHHPTIWSKRGEVNEYDILLTPLDSKIKVVFSNNTGSISKLFFVIYSQAYFEALMGAYIRPSKIAIALPLGQSYTETFAVPSSENLQLAWGDKVYSTYRYFPFRDSMLSKRNETIEYLISY